MIKGIPPRTNREESKNGLAMLSNALRLNKTLHCVRRE